MDLYLYDTYTRSVRLFEPLDSARVGIYACGLTVYDYAHIGNLRSYIFEDTLRRVLEFNGFRVKQVINITDVGHLVSDADEGEDKMEKGSRRTGMTAWEIAEMYTRAFQEDFRRLNILEPTIWCKATDHITEQIELIQCIEEKGYSYRTSDGIYFDTSKTVDYGYLARLDIEGLQAGSRVDIGEKRNTTDFALWKFSPQDEQRQMEWDSPWGIGFPGWHIECSAMAAKYLGPFFDIHCGGEDHIPVHHTNEIAQSQACYGTNLANFWMHGYFLNLKGKKMAKSRGDFLTVQKLIEQGIDPLAYRYFCLNGHYRSKMAFSWDSLEGAATALNRLRHAVYELGEASTFDPEMVAAFRERINNDLNLPRALALTWELLRSELPDSVKKATILIFDNVLGLGLMEWSPAVDVVPDEIRDLVDQRNEARAQKQWQFADELREKIVAAGYELEDTPEGTRIKQQSI
ncbi:MAG: cysteine--tRNA ligase [Candidatus Promineifilaceae bacterium]|nr:cysteine--tRNA ligase [Candidatus Promineifilaceae bacterium]